MHKSYVSLGLQSTYKEYAGIVHDYTDEMWEDLFVFFSSEAAFGSIKGAINGDDSANLKDAILSLQVLSGLNPTGLRVDYASSGADVNNNGKIGLEEVIYILQKVTGLR